jgi:hypothetical protein
LLRQRLVVFITVTVGVALAIATAQGCENRNTRGLAPGADTASSTQSSVPLSIDGLSSPGPSAAAARPPADGALGAASGAVPTVDWPNRSYPDPAGGPAIPLKDGHSTGAGTQIALTTVLPARYRDAPAELIVLRRSEGAVPVDLVQLYGFNGDAPVLVASRSSAADPQAGAVWRIENGALVREERVQQTGATSSTRYTVRSDGTLDESWPGAGISGGTG